MSVCNWLDVITPAPKTLKLKRLLNHWAVLKIELISPKLKDKKINRFYRE